MQCIYIFVAQLKCYKGHHSSRKTHDNESAGTCQHERITSEFTTRLCQLKPPSFSLNNDLKTGFKLAFFSLVESPTNNIFGPIAKRFQLNLSILMTALNTAIKYSNFLFCRGFRLGLRGGLPEKILPESNHTGKQNGFHKLRFI